MSGLRDALAQRRQSPWRPSPVPTERRLRDARHLLEHSLGDPAARIPPATELREAQVQIRRLVEAQVPPNRWPRRWERALPWVVFAPGEPGLYQSAALRSGYRDFLDSLGPRRRARRLGACVLGYLLHFPADRAAAPWRTLLAARLLGSDSPRLSRWRTYDQRLAFLGERRGHRLGRFHVGRDPLAEEFAIGQFSDGAALAGSGLHRDVAAHALDKMKELPPPGLGELDRRLTLLLDRGSRFRFPALRSALADALLLPHANRRPDQETVARIRTLLIHPDHLGDPRLPRDHRWDEVPEARAIFLRWLAADALDLFLQVVSETADLDHWSFRRPFWESYIRLGLVDEAWVAFGAQAAAIARRTKAAGRRHHGRLKGASKTHSVLLLRIGDITIAEWSHSGTCRAWLGTSRWTPDLYNAEYEAGDLRAGADFKKRHAGSEGGHWQNAVESWIRAQTGAGVPRSEYMPQGWL